MLQSREELEKWHSKKDPWQYESTPDDQMRAEVLLSELPERKYKSVLDIGCGQGFVTHRLPGKKILGVDISKEAIEHAKQRETKKLRFEQISLFELNSELAEKFDLIVITGVLYPEYIGKALNLVYLTVDQLLAPGGHLVCVHIDSWYQARFPYLRLKEFYYRYRQYVHRLEVYIK